MQQLTINLVGEDVNKYLDECEDRFFVFRDKMTDTVSVKKEIA